jgi:hypothetical protein
VGQECPGVPHHPFVKGVNNLPLHRDHYGLLHFVAGNNPDFFLSLFLHGLWLSAISFQLSANTFLPARTGLLKAEG